MKNLLVSILIGISFLAGCAKKEHFVDLAKEAQPKTVMIEVDTIVTQMQLSFNGNGLVVTTSTAAITFEGAGVFISPYGHILTCAHLFEEGHLAIRAIRVDGSSVPATLIYASTDTDLGLIKIAAYTPNYATLAKAPLKIGQEVLAVGNPLGFRFSVTHGLISAFRTKFDSGYAYTQTDAAINHGNSGGPLFNLDGELVGINALSISEAHGLSFAIAPSTIREFISLFRGIK